MVEDHSGVGLSSCVISSGSSGMSDEMTQTGCGASCWKSRSSSDPISRTIEVGHRSRGKCALTARQTSRLCESQSRSSSRKRASSIELSSSAIRSGSGPTMSPVSSDGRP